MQPPCLLVAKFFDHITPTKKAVPSRRQPSRRAHYLARSTMLRADAIRHNSACAAAGAQFQERLSSDELQPSDRRVPPGLRGHWEPLYCVAQASRGAQPRDESCGSGSRPPGTGLIASENRSIEMFGL